MTSPSSPLGSPSPCPPPPPSLPSSPTPSAPAPSSLPLPPALPPTGEVMVLALGRKRQRLLIGMSILPNLFLAFLLSSDPLLTLASPFHCRLPGPSPVPQVLNVSVRAEPDRGVGQCKRDVIINNTQSGQTDCDVGYDYNVTEGLRNNIVTEKSRNTGRCSWHVPPGGDPGEDLGHAGGTMSPGWPGNASVSPRKSWRKCLGRGKSGHPCLDCCPCDLAQDKRKKMDGWMDGWTIEWDLVCAQYWLVPVEEVCFILGVLTGSLGLGYMSDRLGRQKSLLVSLMLTVVFGVLVCVSPSPPVFITMRFCLAAASAGVYITLYVSRVELCDPSLRLLATMMSGLMMFAGELFLLGVALGCHSWRGLLGTGAAPLSLFLCYGIPGVFPESPRWLLLSERTGDLNSFNERNERQRDDDSFTELDTDSFSSPGRPRLSLPELLHSRNIWKNLCVLGFTSFISHGISHCYSSFRRDVKGTTPSFYWTYLLSVSAGGGAWLLLWATVERWGRRGILLLAMTLTGIASLILLGLMNYLSESAMTVFSILGLFSSQAAASLSILFTAEVMPTIIRGSGVGAVMALGCVGRLSSPLMDLRNHYGYFLHHVVYSSLALLAVLSILLLPESKRKPLPQTLADGEQYRRPPLVRRRRDNVPLLATPNPET
ncbi:Solute carrier family 22 member 17 24p3 receptor [Triplophysa tibetana]|uniref:Solute carrier family 22 member 17 24p3 receptor n=1 Tax=Triplophysa tibetana TaxID=1572043 RepID=A0A5A9N7U3_9TELE|nr:Solute carrier family 22 member 17 24p3 receptor [Triplophysa tibetana]